MRHPPLLETDTVKMLLRVFDYASPHGFCDVWVLIDVVSLVDRKPLWQATLEVSCYIVVLFGAGNLPRLSALRMSALEDK